METQLKKARKPKKSVYDNMKSEIIKLLETGASKRSVWKIISTKMQYKMSYNSFLNYANKLDFIILE